MSQAFQASSARPPKRDDSLDVAGAQHGLEPFVAIVDDARLVLVLGAAALAVNAVQEGVHHHIALHDAELGQKALGPAARGADQDSAHDGLVLGGILADDEHTRRSVQPAAVKDGPPFDAEVVGIVGFSAGVVGAQIAKGLLAVSGVEFCEHGKCSNLPMSKIAASKNLVVMPQSQR
ncbi:hypothetical protein BRDID11002_75550 [Bradyrhizobium diazoefficiens]